MSGSLLNVKSFYSVSRLTRPHFLIKALPFALTIALLPSHVGYANQTQSPAQKPLFVIKNDPPPDFVALAKDVHQNTYVAVFYEGRFLGNTMASFDHEHIRFLNPQEVLSKIPNLQHRDELAADLTKTLPSNEDLICPYTVRKTVCHVLTPKTAAVIFNAEQYRADLFINSDFVAVKERRQGPLPPSSAGFSFLTQNILNATSVTQNQAYTWGNTSVIADGNNRLTVGFGYSESRNSGVTTSTLNLSQATVGRFDGGRLYQAGMMTPDAGSLLNSQPIGGVSVQNYGILPVSGDVQGSPLIVYLPLPATVVVRRQGQILAAVTLPAGKQQIDTQNFPEGSYNVTLEETNSLGQTTTETRFFVKQTSLPQYGTHNYMVAAGFLQKSTYNTTQQQQIYYPSFYNVPIFSYHELRTLNNQLGLSSSLLSSGSRHYLGEALNYYGDNWTISPGVGVSSALDSVVDLNLQYLFQHVSLGFQTMKVWRSSDFNNIADLNQSAQTFYPLSTNRLQALSNVTFFSGVNSVALGMNWFEDFEGNRQESYHSEYDRMLKNSETGSFLMSISFDRTNQDNVGMIGLTYNFYTPIVNGAAILRYDNQTQNTTGRHEFYPDGSLNLNHNIFWDVGHALALSANSTVNHLNQTYGLNAQYTSPLLFANIGLQQNQFASGYGTNNTQFTSELQSTLAYANGRWSMGYSQGWSTGIILNIEAPKPEMVRVYDNESYIGTFASGAPHPVFVQPYAIHRLTIQPMSGDLYSYDRNPQEVVLYQGNVQTVSWRLEKQYLLFAQVVDPHGQPMSNLLLNNQGEFDITDLGGYVQAGLTESTHLLRFNAEDGRACSVTLPQVNPENGVAVLKKALVCDLK